jgi:hypothetical protein
MNHGHPDVGQSRPALSSVNTDPDVTSNQHASMVLETILKENQVTFKSKSPNSSLSQLSDPISVDRFLKSTSKINATRNYKQARKRTFKEQHLNDFHDTKDHQDSSRQVTSTVKPRRKAGRTHARHRAVTRDLSVPDLRHRGSLPSCPLLHHRWKQVQNVRAMSSVDNLLDTGIRDGLSMTPNPSSGPRVPIFPPGWKEATLQSGPSVKLAHVKATHETARSALSFESIEEHDKKLDLWLASGLVQRLRRRYGIYMTYLQFSWHGGRGKTGSHSVNSNIFGSHCLFRNVPLVRGIYPLAPSIVSRGHHLNKKSPKSVFNALRANNLSQNAASVMSHPQKSGIPDKAGSKRTAGRTNRNTFVPAQR